MRPMLLLLWVFAGLRRGLLALRDGVVVHVASAGSSCPCPIQHGGEPYNRMMQCLTAESRDTKEHSEHHAATREKTLRAHPCRRRNQRTGSSSDAARSYVSCNYLIKLRQLHRLNIRLHSCLQYYTLTRLSRLNCLALSSSHGSSRSNGATSPFIETAP